MWGFYFSNIKINLIITKKFFVFIILNKSHQSWWQRSCWHVSSHDSSIEGTPCGDIVRGTTRHHDSKLFLLGKVVRALPVAIVARVLPMVTVLRVLLVVMLLSMLPVAMVARVLPLATVGTWFPLVTVSRVLLVAMVARALPMAMVVRALPVSTKVRALPVATASLMVAWAHLLQWWHGYSSHNDIEGTTKGNGEEFVEKHKVSDFKVVLVK